MGQGSSWYKIKLFISAFMIPAVCGGIVFASPYILHEILKVDERMNQTAEVTVEP